MKIFISLVVKASNIFNQEILNLLCQLYKFLIFSFLFLYFHFYFILSWYLQGMGCKLWTAKDECQFVIGQPYRVESLSSVWLLVLSLILLSALGTLQKGEEMGIGKKIYGHMEMKWFVEYINSQFISSCNNAHLPGIMFLRLISTLL